ncbi:MAG: Rpn family recombination-promoting nuclease/putative transposase [Turicibacter sp.]|nr:Rpn family recombination-promoting nuclease/putative transposase [Turicibacter sp.]
MQQQQAGNSAFTLMFQKEEYAVQLYEVLTGEELDSSRIKLVNLGDSLTRPKRYNDISFITDENKLLVLIEHQKTPNRNMVFRLLEYYVLLAGRFLKQQNQNRFGTKEVKIPRAEFFVVYNGRKEMADLPKLDLGDVQAKAKVLNIHFDKLANRDGDNAVAAYARLIDLVENQELFINDAIDQLLEEGYLPEFFKQKEMRDMFADVFSYDQELIDFGFEKGVDLGIEQGIEQGIERGASKKAIKIAKKLFGRGLSAEEVAEISELPLDVVQGLVNG